MSAWGVEGLMRGGKWVRIVAAADMTGLEAAAKVMGQRFSNPSPSFISIRKNILRVMTVVFQTGGKGTTARGGFRENKNTPWVGKDGHMIKPGYSDWKKGAYFGDRSGWWAYAGKRGRNWPEPLSLSGRMENSLTKSGARGQVWSPDGNFEFDFGTKVRSRKGTDYPRGHMEGRHGRGGKKKGSRRMVKRPFLNWKLKGAGGRLWSWAIAVPLVKYLFSPSVWNNPAFPRVDYQKIEKEALRAYRTGGLKSGSGNQVWEAK